MTVERVSAEPLTDRDRCAIPHSDAHIFDRDTEVHRAADQTYAATLTDRWSTLLGPSGGYGLAISLRALGAEMPFPDPIATAAFFHAPTSPGPAEIETEIVRRGRSIATGEARLTQRGRERLRVLASYTDLEQAAGMTTELGEPPALLASRATFDLDPAGAFLGSTILERFSYRVVEPHGWRLGTPSGRASLEFMIDFAEPRRLDALALSMIVDVCPRAVYELGEYMLLTLQLTMHLRAKPASGFLVGRVTTRHVRDGFHEEDLDLWDSTGTLVAQSRQLAMLADTPRATDTAS